MSDPLEAALADYVRSSGLSEDRPEAIEEIAAGWESTIHRFGIRLDGELTYVVLRRYSGPHASAKAARESAGMRLLRAVGYPVPEVLAAVTENVPLGQPFMVMRWVPGDPLWGQIFSIPVRFDLLDEFARLEARLHRIDWRPFAARFAVGDSSTPGLIRKELDRWRAVYEARRLHGFEDCFAWLDQHTSDVTRAEPAVVHWDFHPENVLYAPGQPHVVDWTQIDVSDPRFDVAWTLMLVGASEGAGWREAILERYEHHAGARIESLEFFDVAVSVKRLYSVAVSLEVGPEALGMRAEAEASMLAQLDPLRSIYELLQRRTGLRIAEVEALLS